MKFRVAVPGMSVYPGDERHWWEQISHEEMIRIAQCADALGFDYLTVPEHIVIPDDLVGVMGPRWVHCVTAMGVLAGATRKIGIVGLIVVPYHNPIGLAKALATIDYMSGGRQVPIFAVGWLEREFELFGVPWAERGAVMDEYLDAMIELWTSERPSYQGKYVQFENIAFDPRPAQRPTIWMGGFSRVAARRAARVADGYSPWTLTRGQLPEMLELIRSQPEFIERPRALDVFMPLFEGKVDTHHQVVTPPRVVMERDAILGELQALADIGVTLTNADPIFGGGVYGSKGSDGVTPVRGATDFIERLHWFAEEIIAPGRAIGATAEAAAR